VAQMAVLGPLHEPHLHDQLRPHPLEGRHVLGRDPLAPARVTLRVGGGG
jgi:hypothetical protein